MRSIFRVGGAVLGARPHPKNFSLRSKFFDLPTRGRFKIEPDTVSSSKSKGQLRSVQAPRRAAKLRPGKPFVRGFS
jgi:hypothetical protein